MEAAEFQVPEDKKAIKGPAEVMRSSSAVTKFPQAEKSDQMLPRLLLKNVSIYIFISSIFENLISKYLTLTCNTR